MEDKSTSAPARKEGTGRDRKAPDYYDRRAIDFLNAAMGRKGVSIDVLDERLRKLGYDRQDTPKTLRQRIDRGGFSAGFFVRVLRALEVSSIEILREVELMEWSKDKKLTEEHEQARAKHAARARAVKKALRPLDKG